MKNPGHFSVQINIQGFKSIDRKARGSDFQSRTFAQAILKFVAQQRGGVVNDLHGLTLADKLTSGNHSVQEFPWKWLVLALRNRHLPQEPVVSAPHVA